MKFGPDALKPVVADELAVVCRVSLAAAVVEVLSPHFFRRQTTATRYSIDDLLHHEHPLRSTKTAECGIRAKVRLSHATGHFHRRDVVSIVVVEHRAIADRLREIEGPSAIREQLGADGQQMAAGVVTNLKPR